MDSSEASPELVRLRLRVSKLTEELARSRAELEALEAAEPGHQPPPGLQGAPGLLPFVTARSPAAEKLALFMQRFSGRDDVYARRWVSAKTGKSGWSPATAGGYFNGAETDADLLPLTPTVIEQHLRGNPRQPQSGVHVGLYPMLKNDHCRLLVCDFDDGHWRQDAAAYVMACQRAGLGVLAEISRSGSGAHVWMFFDTPIQAAQARAAGMRMLRAAMEARPSMEFGSYDRFFPAQDTLPERASGRTRLGNLIALPLQGDCRRRGTTVFAEVPTWRPFEDQFAALASVSTVPASKLSEIVTPETRSDPEFWKPARARPSRKEIQASLRAAGLSEIAVRRDATTVIPASGLHPSLIAEIKHMASIPNPEFYRKQAQRFSTFGTPRLITCFGHDAAEVRVPRGLYDDVTRLLAENGLQVTHSPATARHTEIDFTFTGALRPDQRAATDAIARHDLGVLVAPPGSGKTVIACALIAERKLPAAVLVNRAELAAQWRARLQQFLGLSNKQIGQLGAGRRKRRGLVDLIMMQSIAHRASDPRVLEEYGQVIIDECHAVAAPAIEAALRHVNVPYWVGLTATPYRADQLNALITMQCGPIRHEMPPPTRAPRQVAVHETDFTTNETGADGASIQAIYSELAANTARNELIATHVSDAASEGRSCLVLTNRLDHLTALADLTEDRVTIPVLRLHGQLTPADRRAVRERLTQLDHASERFVLIAIDKVAGEGLDLPALNSLFLAMPVSFKGRVIQQIGRVTRGTGRVELTPTVHDYRDKHVPLLERMHQRRRRIITTEGFSTADEETVASIPSL